MSQRSEQPTPRSSATCGSSPSGPARRSPTPVRAARRAARSAAWKPCRPSPAANVDTNAAHSTATASAWRPRLRSTRPRSWATALTRGGPSAESRWRVPPASRGAAPGSGCLASPGPASWDPSRPALGPPPPPRRAGTSAVRASGVPATHGMGVPRRDAAATQPLASHQKSARLSKSPGCTPRPRANFTMVSRRGARTPRSTALRVPVAQARRARELRLRHADLVAHGAQRFTEGGGVRRGHAHTLPIRRRQHKDCFPMRFTDMASHPPRRTKAPRSPNQTNGVQDERDGAKGHSGRRDC
jgi:hypothetical protein